MENLTDSRKTVETGVDPRLEMEKQPTCSLGEKDNQKIKLWPDGFHGYCLNHDVCAGAIKPKRRSEDHFPGKDM